jgi:hypothetical protein
MCVDNDRCRHQYGSAQHYNDKCNKKVVMVGSVVEECCKDKMLWFLKINFQSS